MSDAEQDASILGKRTRPEDADVSMHSRDADDRRPPSENGGADDDDDDDDVGPMPMPADNGGVKKKRKGTVQLRSLYLENPQEIQTMFSSSAS
jgi:peptidylprolyl isomerase domain and WD repeat-containing protein 1